MVGWQDLVAIVVAYLLGCIATAYYIVRLRTGQDIRQLGSGNVGGRNAGRVLGLAGFAIVAVVDALKGLLAVLFARYLGVGEWTMALVMLAVLMLHPPPASAPRVDLRPVPPVVAPRTAPEAADPSVRVEHELVRLPRPRPQPINRPVQWRSARLAAAESSDSRPTLILRARRAFVGDGRYKPEPFPRLGR